MYRKRPNLLEKIKAGIRKILGPLRNFLASDRFGWPWRIEETPTLVTLFIFSAITFALYLATLADISNGLGGIGFFRSTGKALPPHQGNIPAFRLSGIQLGMTPVEVGSVHPSIFMSGPPAASQTGHLKIGNGDYSVSFKGPRAGRKSYRIHYTETFPDFSDSEVLERLRKKFGPPDVNRCALETAFTVRVCRLRWLRPDSVVLDAVTRSTRTARSHRATQLEFTALSRRTQAHGKKNALTRLQAISSAARGM